jgi:hypothetical protein
MRRIVLRLLFGLGTVLGIISCASSREVKTTAFKELSANYNVLFYGEEALAEASARLDGSLFDLRTSPSLLPASLREGPRDSSVFALLERAEEKATKAIQKFSVTIGGTEYNKHVPRAYHLLGMARLLSGRPYPALEAFEKEKELTEGLKSNDQALLGIALTRYHLGACREALAQLARLSAKNRSEQSTMLELELLRLTQSDTLLLALGRAATKRGVKKQSNRARFALAKQYARLNADTQSKKLFEKLSKLKGYHNAWLRTAASVELASAYAQDSGLYFNALQRIERKWSNHDARYIVSQSRGNWMLNTARQHPKRKELFEGKVIKAYQASNLTADEETKNVNTKALGDYFLETRNYEASYAYYDTLVASYVLQSGEAQVRQLHQKLTRYLDLSEQLRIKDSLLLTQNAGEEDELLKLNASALAPGTAVKRERQHLELLESISDLRFELSGLLAYDFGDYTSAANHLQKLTVTPYSQSIQEAALFRLFQISRDLGYEDQAEGFGNKLRSTNSIYASYVNPEENTASEFEHRLATAYQESDLQRAYQTAQEALKKRQPLSAESLLLVAIIEAQIEGVQSYSKRLKEVQQIFRNSWGSREATNRLEAIEKQPAMEIVSQGRFAVVIDTDQKNAAQLRVQMADLLEEQNYEATAILDSFDSAKSLLVVGWFTGENYAERFVSQNPKAFLNKKTIIISQADYLRAQIYKSNLF